MKRIPRWWWAAALSCVVLTGGCKCGDGGGPGTGGSGEPLAEDTEESGGRELKLEIIEVFTRQAGTTAPPRTSFVTQDEMVARARVQGVDAKLADGIRWTVRPVGTHTGPATPAEATGPELVFRGSSALPVTGSRDPNLPLEYEVVASLALDGGTLEAKLPPTTFIRQEEADILRQEYVDYGTTFKPTLANVNVPGRTTLNRGNYNVIVEEKPGELDRLLHDLEVEVNRLLNDDVQVVRVGALAPSPNSIVVSPGPSVLMLGALGDTEPKGDDICAGPRVNNGCAGAIRAGPNRIADTLANNRKTQVNLETIITSAYRNPQRNKFIGSGTINSRHTRGLALDLDPRFLVIPGKDARQLMCIVELAGIRVAGEDNSFSENGPVTFLDCNDPAADHVHVQR
ncbi:D-Ala-D-Ala carboxypeptidase family metallohydrolase [Pyxidicoccus sp. 3LG]